MGQPRELRSSLPRQLLPFLAPADRRRSTLILFSNETRAPPAIHRTWASSGKAPICEDHNGFALWIDQRLARRFVSAEVAPANWAWNPEVAERTRIQAIEPAREAAEEGHFVPPKNLGNAARIAAQSSRCRRWSSRHWASNEPPIPASASMSSITRRSASTLSASLASGERDRCRASARSDSTTSRADARSPSLTSPPPPSALPRRSSQRARFRRPPGLPSASTSPARPSPSSRTHSTWPHLEPALWGCARYPI